jgi:hypothetical protein
MAAPSTAGGQGDCYGPSVWTALGHRGGAVLTQIIELLATESAATSLSMQASSLSSNSRASSSDPLRCGRARWDRAQGGGLPTEQRMTIRIGINHGDMIVDGGDVFGDGVNGGSGSFRGSAGSGRRVLPRSTPRLPARIAFHAARASVPNRAHG